MMRNVSDCQNRFQPCCFNKRFGKIFRILLCFSLVGILFTSLNVQAQIHKKVIHVGYIPLIPQLPIIVSYERDKLIYQNVTVKLVKYNSYTSLEAAIRVGAIDAADIPLPVIFDMAGDNVPVKIVGQAHSGGDLLEGVDVNTISQLRGKIIGVPGVRTNENLQLIQSLSKYKLRYGLDYKTIKVPFNTILTNLEKGKINVMYFPEPYASLAEQRCSSHKIAVNSEGQSEGITTLICIRSELLDSQYNKAIREWIQSLANASSFIEKDIRSFSAGQTAILQESFFGFDRQLVQSSLVNRKGNIRFIFKFPNEKILRKYMQLGLETNILTHKILLDNIIVKIPLAKKIKE